MQGAKKKKEKIYDTIKNTRTAWTLGLNNKNSRNPKISSSDI